MKKLFTLLAFVLASFNALADKIEVNLGNYDIFVANSEGSYDFASPAWGWKGIWLDEDATRADHPYLVVELAAPSAGQFKLVAQFAEASGYSDVDNIEQPNCTMVVVNIGDNDHQKKFTQIGLQTSVEATYKIKSIYLTDELPSLDILTQISNITDNGDGSYTVPCNDDWSSWNNIWLGTKDWSEYDYLVLQSPEPFVNEKNAKIQIEYNNKDIKNGEFYRTAGSELIVAKIDDAGKSNVKQIALQGNANYKASHLYLLAKTGTTTISSPADSYSTFFLDKAFVMPEGLTGIIVTGAADGNLTLEEKYPAGSIVPANTALLIKSEAAEAKDYTANTVNIELTAPTQLLRGSVDAEATTGGDRYYKLSYDDAGKNLGFYYAEEGGASFTNAAGRAYLALTGSSAKAYVLDANATGIRSIATAQSTNDEIYTIAGQRVNSASQPGLYIIGGKKVVVK